MSDIFTDFLPIGRFAKDVVHKHTRTVLRWMDEPDGLPYTKLGNVRLIHIPTAREWILSRMSRRNPDRRHRRRNR
jgi:hypothetical protein